jgi:ribose transport system permease protein
MRSAARLLAPLVALFLIVGGFAIHTRGAFLRPDSLLEILKQSALIVIVGVGQTLVIVAGGIDLSVGAVVAFSGSLAAVLMLHYGVSPVLAALCGTVAGGVIGFFNGAITVKARLHPFIITLGSMMIFRGLALALTHAQNTSLLPEAFNAIGSAEIAVPLGPGRQLMLGPVLVAYIIVLAVAAHLFLSRTRQGRYCFAIGSNAVSARLSGVPVDRCITLYFVLAGLLFGFGGVVQAARIRIGQPTIGEGLELEAIAAAVIGGTSLSGGQGSIGGTVIGALLMASLRHGLGFVNLEDYWQRVALGSAIVLAVIYDRASRRLQH